MTAKAPATTAAAKKRSNNNKSKTLLIGRDTEYDRLTSIWNRVCAQQGPAEAILVHGDSGTGKTAFCRQLLLDTMSSSSSLDVNEQEEERSSSSTTVDESIIDDGYSKNPPVHYFASGKFDQYEYSPNNDNQDGRRGTTTKPFSAIIKALDSLGASIIQNSSDASQQHQQSAVKGARQALHQSLSSRETSVLRNRIPSFAQACKDHECDSSTKPPEAASISNHHQAPDSSSSSSQQHLSLIDTGFGDSERFALAVREFLKKFLSSSFVKDQRSSIVLFIDDLQWGDKESFDLLQAIMMDETLSSVLILGAFRSSEGAGITNESLEQFQTFLRHTSRFTEIQLSALSEENVQEFVSQILDGATASALGSKVFAKTKGNPMSIVQTLAILQRQRKLSFDDDDNEWKEEGSSSSSDYFSMPSPDLVNLLTQRVRDLPGEVQLLLQIASCIGFVFDTSILQVCFSEIWKMRQGSRASGVECAPESPAFSGILEQAKEEGMISLALESESMRRFEHDKIQQAVYEMIGSEEERLQMHKILGRHIYETQVRGNLNPDEIIYEHLVLATDQLNRSAALMSTGENELERLELIALNLRVGQIARTKGGMVTMAGFVDKAVSLIRDQDWDSAGSYEMVLETYTLSCESAFSRGQFHLCRKRCAVVEKYARNLKDKIRALVIQIQVHGVLREFSEAIQATRTVMKQLGETLPPSWTASVIYEFLKAKRLASGKDDEFFLQLKPMTDWTKVVAMKVLKAASVYAWNRGDQAFAGICFLRLFIITATYGFCEDTPYAFATFGMMLAATKDEEKGVRFAKLALDSSARSESPNPSTLVAVYVFLWHLRHPVSHGLEPLLAGYRTGLEIGDMEFGSICYSAYVDLYVLCGLPLAPFVSDIENFGAQLRLCRQELPLAFILPLYQMALNLCGRTRDPKLVTWDSCRNLSLFSDNLTRYTDSRGTMNLYQAQLFNAYLLRDAKLLEKTLEDIRKLNNYELDGTHFATYFFALNIGLSTIMVYRVKRSRKHLSLAKRMVHWFEQVCLRRYVECVGMLRLLEAELESSSSSSSTTNTVAAVAKRRSSKNDSAHIVVEVDDKMRSMYDQAIAQLARGGFTHFCAIACEQAGRYFEDHEDEHWSKAYIERAAVLYEEWGAVVKVKELGKEYNTFITPGELKRNDSTVINIRGRKRFSADTDDLRHVIPQ